MSTPGRFTEVVILARATARLVIIGDEILSGKVQDANSPWLLRRLRRRGVACTGVAVVADRIEDVAVAVRAATSADHVFTSGGVGPTHDDITMAGVAAAFGRPLVRHPELAAFLEARWHEGPAGPRARMSLVPEGSSVEHLGHFPQVRVENVWIFPGVPRLFRDRWEAVAERFGGARPVCAAVHTQQSEGEISALLEEIVADFSGVDVGSYPRWDDPDVKVLVTLEADDGARVRAAADALIAKLDPQRLGRVDRDYRPEDDAG